ncbi:hypothetical protein LOC68_06485 [Blastopirellula sp. JC732]|uniref:Uncharacterized protein n=1 Tax=Blastopirellula sediminis TaxID=2894196 RepID=A0A9X1MK68_9BACT|nr:hypothetical protein [Blastopirellula sediminis]MCC9609187.1 hypothetical protein [Blastopirellula sediminis]MCC9628036.1 hypothetical protein [Blastopirellula sediminis]
MVATQLRRQFQKFGHWILLGVSVVMLAVVLAGPSATNTDVAWHGRRVYRAYYAPVVPVVPVVPVYRPVIRRAYYAPVVPIAPVAPVYYGAPYGGAVVSPYAEVYW